MCKSDNSKPTNDCCPNCRDRLIGVRELASMLPIAEKSVRNKLSAGTFPIPSYLFGGKRAFKLSEILEYIKNLE